MNRFTLSRRQRAGTKRPARARPVLEPLEGRSLLSNPTLGPLEQVLAAGQPTPSGAAGQAAASWITLDDPKATGDTFIFGINNAGDIVGAAIFSGERQGFLLHDGIYTTLEAPGAEDTYANGINPEGFIVGGAKAEVPAPTHGYLLHDGTYTAFNVPGATGGTHPHNINTAGDIVGTYIDSQKHDHGFLLHDGTYTTLDVP